ncbi:MAG: type II secretion system F family protein [Oscillospiraceae bacterium]|jgi:tight adherence protein C|nr:type II secretion system F family protein [Oscillospiraceae bacterium]
MLILALSLATALSVVWLVLLSMVNRDDWIVAAYNKVFDNMDAIDKLRQKAAEHREKLSRYHGFASVVIRPFLSVDVEAKVKRIEQDNERLQSGKLRSINIFAMPGYVLQRRIIAIGKGGIHKAIMTKSYEYYGRKHAINKTKNLLAKLLSYPIIGVAMTLIIGALLIGTISTTVGYAILGIGSVLVLVLVYAMYDNLSDSVRKRRNAICRQFPGVVSKLALLVTSGMIMERAWKETAYSQETELYQEMRKTSQELDNLVSPEAAYGGFISRCNTKETAKLASAIMQNLSKGNAEIGRLLKNLAREAWLERRHNAKRDAEKANSRLMIPTMLLLLAILVMLMVPVAMNFSGI